MKVIKKESAKAENKNIIELPEEVSIELNDRTIVLEKGERVEIMGKVEEAATTPTKDMQRIADFYFRGNYERACSEFINYLGRIMEPVEWSVTLAQWAHSELE